MIVALLAQKGGVGKSTLALHLAGQWAREGKRVVLVDSDPQRSAHDWSQARGAAALPRLFAVLSLARDTLHREAPELARHTYHVVIDGPPRVASLMRSALPAADLVLIRVSHRRSTDWHRPRCWRCWPRRAFIAPNSPQGSFSIGASGAP